MSCLKMRFRHGSNANNESNESNENNEKWEIFMGNNLVIN